MTLEGQVEDIQHNEPHSVTSQVSVFLYIDRVVKEMNMNHTDFDSVLYDVIQTVYVWLNPSTSLSLIFTFVQCG